MRTNTRLMLSAVSPVFGVQTAVLHRFRDMCRPDHIAVVQIRYRTRNFQQTVMCACGQAQPLKGGFQQPTSSQKWYAVIKEYLLHAKILTPLPPRH